MTETAKVTPERVHEMFFALRFHLTSSYDFRKYNGKIKRLGRKPDGKHFFLAKKFPVEEDLYWFFVLNFSEHFRTTGRVPGFIGDFSNDSNIDVYNELNPADKYKYITEDIEKLFADLRSSGLTAKELLADAKKFFSLYLSGKVTVYTMVAFIKTFNLLDRFGEDIDPLVNETKFFMSRIILLIKINPTQFKDIIKKAKENLNVIS